MSLLEWANFVTDARLSSNTCARSHHIEVRDEADRLQQILRHIREIKVTEKYAKTENTDKTKGLCD